jgi:hypothetical protein
MTQDFLDTDIYPHKTDYCAKCFEFKTLLESLETQLTLHKINYYNSFLHNSY